MAKWPYPYIKTYVKCEGLPLGFQYFKEKNRTRLNLTDIQVSIFLNIGSINVLRT